MPTRVKVPGLGFVSFPDGMSPEDMAAAIDVQLSGGQTTERDNPPSVPVGGPPSLAGFGRNLVDSGLNTAVGLVTGLPKLAMKMATDPKGVGQDVTEGIGNRAKEVWNDPLGVAYRDPVGIAADVAGVASLGKMGLKSVNAGKGMAGAVAATEDNLAARRAAAPRLVKAAPAKPPQSFESILSDELRSGMAPTPAATTLPAAATPSPPTPQAGVSIDAAQSAWRDKLKPMGDPMAGLRPDSIARTESQPPPQPAAAAMPDESAAAKTAAPPPEEGPHDSYQRNMRSTEDPTWHSGAEPGTPEADRMSALHREDADMDHNFRRRIMDEKGIVTPDLLTGILIDMIGRKLISNPALRRGAVATVKGSAGAIGGAVKSVAEPALNMSVIGRFLNEGDGKQ